MKNTDFIELLRNHQHPDTGKRWTIEDLAAAIYSGRAHVTMVLANRSGRGGRTRIKLVKLFKKNFAVWPAMLATLGWTEAGESSTGNVPYETKAGGQHG